jgi:hypothetical protein
MRFPPSNSRGASVALWFVVVTLTLSIALSPLVAMPAAAADAHLGISSIELEPTNPAPGQRTELQVKIRNGPNSGSAVDVTNVYVRPVDSPNDIIRIREVGTVPVGGNITVPLSVSFEESGTKNLRVFVVGREAEGSYVNVRYPLTVDVEEPDRPQLELSTGEAISGATRPVNVTVANGLDRNLRQLRVTTSSPAVNFSVNERVKARLQSGNTTTFSFPARVAESGTYPVNATFHYAQNGIERTISKTYQANFESPSNPGELVLTDLQATQRGTAVEISATAGNVGSSTVEGVVVSVANESRVERSKYFVGSVEESDFSSFTLTSSVAGNVSSVPLRVTYSVDGVRRSFTTTVRVDRMAVRPQQPQGNGLPLLPIGGAVVALIVAALVFRWRR